MQKPQSILRYCMTGGPPCVCRVGCPVWKLLSRHRSCPSRTPAAASPCSSFAFNSLQQLEPLRIYLLGGMSGSWTLSDTAQGCASLCGRGITEMIVLPQKLNCFVKEKLSETRAETYATHLTHSLFDAKRSQGWYTVYSILCLLCLSCEYFRAGIVSYPLNKQQLRAWRKLKHLSQLAYFSMPEEPGWESSGERHTGFSS